MGQDSKIEWTDNTFNTHWGCNKVSEGCVHCYAKTIATQRGYGHCFASGGEEGGTVGPVFPFGCRRYPFNCGELASRFR